SRPAPPTWRQTLRPTSDALTTMNIRLKQAVALALATNLALGLGACSAPVMKPAVEVPEKFVAAAASEQEPEVAWWESYGDPVLSDLTRRAAVENRDVKIAAERVRAARAGETISRSWLFPSIGLSASGIDQKSGYPSSIKNAVPDAADAKVARGGL